MNERNYTPFLSKSRFVKGLQCHKALWLQTHRPELKDDVGEERQAVFDAGHDVGRLAQQMFTDGIEVPFDNVPLAEQVAMTRRLIDAGKDVIFEAAFSYDNVFIKADIMTKGASGWHLGEVKASTDAKEHYINDIAVQYHVITGCGVPVEKASLVLINTGYVRTGDIEPEKLFTWVDVTEEVLQRQEQIKEEIFRQRAMLKADIPQIDIGPYCSNPYDCDYMGHCWAHVPEDSVFRFADKGKPDCFKLYHEGTVKMKDTPPEILGWRQKMQLECLLNKSTVLDKAAIKAFLDDLRYPLAFLDFETTCFTPIPLFDNTRPYQQVPFQFSLHIQDSATADLRHVEFLAPQTGDPQEPFLEALLNAIPENACIVSWNAPFEGRIMKELAATFPDKMRALQKLIDNRIDLMAPYRSKQIYHWQFDGSYSIKAVLPALLPEFSYDELEIGDGATAANAWLNMGTIDDDPEFERVKKNLLEYCRMDTLAMVMILEKMRDMVRDQ